MSHGRAPVETITLLGLVASEQVRKASEEAVKTVEGEMHSHKNGYLQNRNDDWKGEIAGRHNQTKESRCTAPT